MHEEFVWAKTRSACIVWNSWLQLQQLTMNRNIGVAWNNFLSNTRPTQLYHWNCVWICNHWTCLNLWCRWEQMRASCNQHWPYVTAPRSFDLTRPKVPVSSTLIHKHFILQNVSPQGTHCQCFQFTSRPQKGSQRIWSVKSIGAHPFPRACKLVIDVRVPPCKNLGRTSALVFITE